jgi:hypothetical protein
LRGLVLLVSNERLSWIAKYRITVYTAQSFDARYEDFRDSVGFKAIVIQKNEPIEASGIGRAIWLIRREANSDQLFVGEDNTSPLKWPPNDPSTTQMWKLAIGIDAETLATPTNPSRPLQHVKFSFSVTWDKQASEFSLNKIYT